MRRRGFHPTGQAEVGQFEDRASQHFVSAVLRAAPIPTQTCPLASPPEPGRRGAGGRWEGRESREHAPRRTTPQEPPAVVLTTAECRKCRHFSCFKLLPVVLSCRATATTLDGSPAAFPKHAGIANPSASEVKLRGTEAYKMGNVFIMVFPCPNRVFRI